MLKIILITYIIIVWYLIIARILFLYWKKKDVGVSEGYYGYHHDQDFIGTITMAIFWPITLPSYLLFKHILKPSIQLIDSIITAIVNSVVKDKDEEDE